MHVCVCVCVCVCVLGMERAFSHEVICRIFLHFSAFFLLLHYDRERRQVYRESRSKGGV